MAGRLWRVLPKEFAALSEIKRPRFPEALNLERVRRVELPTLCLASIRSSQLSYTRMLLEVHEENDFVNLLKITLRQPCLEQAKKLQVIIYAGPKRDGSGQGQKVHPRGKEIQSPVRVMYEQANDGECLKNEFIFP